MQRDIVNTYLSRVFVLPVGDVILVGLSKIHVIAVMVNEGIATAINGVNSKA